MSEIEKLRKSKPLHAAVPWMFLTAAILWFGGVFLESMSALTSGDGALDGVYAASFAAFLLAYYAATQQRLNAELVAEIDALRRRLPASDQAERDHG